MQYVNQRLQIQLELLMMSGILLETCWAFNEQWNNKFCYKVASCWLFLLNHSMWTLRCPGITSSVMNPMWTTIGLSPGLLVRCQQLPAWDMPWPCNLIISFSWSHYILDNVAVAHVDNVAVAHVRHLQKFDEHEVTSGNFNCPTLLSPNNNYSNNFLYFFTVLTVWGCTLSAMCIIFQQSQLSLTLKTLN